jgi:hypothetical protein
MKELLKKYQKPVVVISIIGVCFAGLGLLTKVMPIYYTGLVLASPLYLVCLPLCCIMLLCWMTWPLWIPLYRLATKRHGAPFKPGDVVRVLRGPHHGKVLNVYEVWNERDQVRLDLGETEKKNVTDVFTVLSVQRVEKSEQSPAPYSSPAAGSESGEA